MRKLLLTLFIHLGLQLAAIAMPSLSTPTPKTPLKTTDHHQNTRPRSVIIIGAGVASIKLAHTILQSDPKISITIFEANDYIGGRVRNFNFCGHTVEMGANWISGREDAYANPIWKLAKNVGLKGHTSDRDDAEKIHAVDAMGRDITNEYLETVERFNAVYERAIKKVAYLDLRPEKDADVRSILQMCGWAKCSDLNSIERAVEFNVLEVWVCDGLDRLSAAHDMKEGANDVDLGQDEFFVEDSRGFNFILQGMLHDLKAWGADIKLSSEVRAVEYTPGNVGVVARDFNSGKVTEHKADAVVSTVSLGVLQSKSIQFSPPLPNWKEAALNEIGMFNFAKVFAKFETKFWPDKDQLVVVGRKGYYPLWMRYRSTEKGQHLFMCYLGGAEARRVESLSTEQITDEVEELFYNAYRDRLGEGYDSSIFRPVSVAVTDWSRNPRFRGSYSYFPVRALSNVSETDLARGLTGMEEEGEGKGSPITLYFAGECFDDMFNGWVQGAYRSGERVARCILGC